MKCCEAREEGVDAPHKPFQEHDLWQADAQATKVAGKATQICEIIQL